MGGKVPDESQPIEGQLGLEIFEEDSAGGRPAVPPPPPPAGEGVVPQLRRVWFRDFKGFSDTTIDLGHFNVLVGVNNAGKSTVLEGVDLLFTLLAIHAEGERLRPGGRLISPEVLPVSEVRDLFYMRQNRRSNVYVHATVGAEFTDGSRVEFGVRHLFGGANSQVTEEVGMTGARLRALIQKPAVWVPSAVGIVRDEEFRTPARRAALIAGGRHNEILRNQLVKLREDRPDAFESLQETLEARFGAQLAGVEFDELADQFIHADYLGGDGRRHDLYSTGSGFVQIVQLLAFILSRPTSVVLLDEPDAHLHSSMQRTVIDILEDLVRDEGIQVVLATHSKEIINFVDPSRLILVDPAEVVTGPVSDEITPLTILKELGSIDNIDAVSLLRSKRCLFLEGDSDLLVFDRFAARVGLTPFLGDDRVVVMQVGGADRFGHVEQLDVLERLLGAPLASLEVRDRDGRLDQDREAIVTDSPRPLHMLNRDCIESYLVEPVVLHRIIEEIFSERARAEDPPDLDAVSALVDEVAETLRDVANDHLADRLGKEIWRRESRHAGVPELNAAAREVVDAVWGDRERRLSVLPGKRLLSGVRREIQDRYSVNFGNERLAEGFGPEEVPEELIEVLSRVAALT